MLNLLIIAGPGTPPQCLVQGEPSHPYARPRSFPAGAMWPLAGHSRRDPATVAVVPSRVSPVVAGDRLFVTGAVLGVSHRLTGWSP